MVSEQRCSVGMIIQLTRKEEGYSVPFWHHCVMTINTARTMCMTILRFTESQNVGRDRIDLLNGG